MNSRPYLYDVALSFTEEKRDVAVSIALALEAYRLKHYYYPYEYEVTLGYDLTKKLPRIYEFEAKHAIVLFSKNYLSKRFTKIEFDAVLKRSLREEGYLIPVILDDVQLSNIGLSDDVTYIKWNSDPKAIASIVCKKVEEIDPINTLDPKDYFQLKQQNQELIYNYINYYQKKVAGSRKDGNDYLELGLLYLYVKKTDLAKENLKIAVRLKPGDSDAYYYAALGLLAGKPIQSMSFQDAKLAVEWITNSIELDRNKFIYCLLGLILENKYFLACGLKSSLPPANYLNAQIQNLPKNISEIERLNHTLIL